MANLQAIIFSKHPDVIFNAGVAALSLTSLTSVPSFIPLVLTLTTIHLYIRIIHRRENFLSRLFVFWGAISLGGSFANVSSAIDALSTPAMSLAVLATMTLFQTAFALFITLIDVRSSGRFKTPWAQMLLFPALWATSWKLAASISPLGRLLMWSPVQGFEAYQWIMPIAGPAGIDWTVAACAVVLSQVAGAWLMGPGQDTDEGNLTINEFDDIIRRPPPPSQPLHVLTLTSLLVALTVPSFVISATPLPISSTASTPLKVGCVLPSSIYDKSEGSALERFIKASAKLNSANILIWPESAVTFASPAERDAAFVEVRKRVVGPSVGVSFEEYVPAEESGRVGMRRNGFALLAPSGSTDPGPAVDLQYFKRNLVPSEFHQSHPEHHQSNAVQVAESFALTPGHEPATIFEKHLGPPAIISKTKWSPSPDHTRPIPVTASICLDLSSTAAFSELPSRPALILAPGKTWHPGVGLAMWEQAKSRAWETGSMVLWCDGGEGGVSGVAGGGMTDYVQVGEGSWMRTIGVQWPFDERRTIYASKGDWWTMAVLWVLLGGGWVAELAVSKSYGVHSIAEAGNRFIYMIGAWRKRRLEACQQARVGGEQQSLLG